MSLTAVVKVSIGVSQWPLPGRALSHCQASPAALSRREQTPLLFSPPLSLLTSSASISLS